MLTTCSGMSRLLLAARTTNPVPGRALPNALADDAGITALEPLSLRLALSPHGGTPRGGSGVVEALALRIDRSRRLFGRRRSPDDRSDCCMQLGARAHSCAD